MIILCVRGHQCTKATKFLWYAFLLYNLPILTQHSLAHKSSYDLPDVPIPAKLSEMLKN